MHGRPAWAKRNGAMYIVGWRTGQVISQPGWNASARQNSSAAWVSNVALLGERHVVDAPRRLAFADRGRRSKSPSAHCSSIASCRSLSAAILSRRLRRRDVHGVAVEPGPGHRRTGVAVEDAEVVWRRSAAARDRRRRAREPREPLGRREIDRGAASRSPPAKPALTHCRPAIRSKSGRMSLVERGLRGRRQHPALNRDVAHQVPHRADRLLLRRVVGRRDDDPGRRDRRASWPSTSPRGDRTVGDVVVPAFVVGEGDGAACRRRRPTCRGRRARAGGPPRR